MRPLLARLSTALSIAVALTSWVAPCRAGDDDINALIKSLSSADAAAREAAADAIGHLGPRGKAAAGALAKALRDKSAAVRAQAAHSLGAISPDAKVAVPALLAGLRDPEAKVRGYAAHALGQIGDKSKPVVDSLSELIVDKDALVRRASMRALRQLKLPREVTVPMMAKVLKAADPADAMSAVATMAESGEAAVPFLIEALKDPQGGYWACLALAEIGPKAKVAVPHLAALQQHADPEVCMQALVALGEIGPEAKSAVPVLTKALETDEAGGVRYAAAYALGQIAAHDEKAIAALTHAAQSDDKFLQILSAFALARISPQDQQGVARAVDQLVEGMKSDDVHVRRAAARALTELHAPPEVVGPVMLKAIKDADPVVIGNAVEALASQGPKVVGRVAERLKDKDFRLYAARVLARIGHDAKEAAGALVAALPGTEDDPEFRREVQFTLGLIGPEAAPATPELIKSLSSDNERVRNSALFALGKIGPGAQEAVAPLRKLLESNEQILRVGEIWALVQIQPGDKDLIARAVPMLAKGLAAENEFRRLEIATALGNIGPAAKAALPDLNQALKDPSPAVRKAAARAIEQIAGKTK